MTQQIAHVLFVVLVDRERYSLLPTRFAKESRYSLDHSQTAGSLMEILHRMNPDSISIHLTLRWLSNKSYATE